jgi:tripartite-type tricarboxylate transporter receptor subunit TctC
MLATGFTLPANTGYEAKDFAPVGAISSTPIVVMAHPSLPVNSLSDVIALAKKDPGKLSAGTPPPPTLNYFAIELMKAMGGIDLTIVTYKGTGPLTNDLVGGHVPLAFNTIAPALGNIQAGKIRAIAVAAPKRVEGLPNVPTFAELGLPKVNDPAWYGLVAPAKTPDAIVMKLNAAAAKVLSLPDVRDKLKQSGSESAANSPAQHAAEIKNELEKARAVVQKQGIKLETS